MSAFPPIGRSALGVRRLLLFFRARQSRFLPRAKPARQRPHVLVSHLLQAFGHKRRAAAPTAITNDRRLQIRDLFFDFELDDATTQMLRAFGMIFPPALFFANVDHYGLPSFDLLSGFRRRNLGDVL